MHSISAPQSAYVHVPFCRRRCGYCNFTLVAGRDDLIPAYLGALEKELQDLSDPRPVKTVFLGGGTPSHLRPAALLSLLQLVNRWFPLKGAGEFSVEANPEDVDSQRLDVFRQGGVTRISLGGQSFDDDKLRRLERSHTGSMLTDAVHQCRAAGFDVAVDLIFAAPDETLATWRHDLESLVALRPDHVSTYGLTYERGAAFWSERAKGELRELGEDASADMYELAIDLLQRAHYEHYEVSNFAKPGKRCRHNEAYWLGDSYYAAGPGAARFVDGRRETNHRSTTTYIRRLQSGESPVHEIDSISAEARARELFVFAMRRCEGVDCQAMFAATGFDPRRELLQSLEQFESWGLIAWDGSRVFLTRRGLLVSDSMWGEVLLDENAD